MNNSIKNIILGFFVEFLILSVVGHFVPVLGFTITNSFGLSFAIFILNLIVYKIRKIKEQKIARM